MAYSD